MCQKGENREKGLEFSDYTSSEYFELYQLCSYAHQINDIYKMGVTNILEVGIGSGITSDILRKSGCQITTVDINPNLSPDICAPISELGAHLNGRKFDLVVCCEVLEHMKFDLFEKNIETLRGLSKKLYLTLPSYRRTLGLGGMYRIPRLGLRPFSLILELPNRKPISPSHFWEVDSDSYCKKKNIKRILGKYYSSIESSRYSLNPMHIKFVASS